MPQRSKCSTNTSSLTSNGNRRILLVAGCRKNATKKSLGWVQSIGTKTKSWLLLFLFVVIIIIIIIIVSIIVIIIIQLHFVENK